MITRKIIPVFTAAALFFAIPGAQKAHACPDANGVLTHCAQFQVIVGIVSFITSNVFRPPGETTFIYGPNAAAVNLINQTTLFNIFYFSALMSAIAGPFPTGTEGTSGESAVQLEGRGFDDLTVDTPLCTFAGDCSEGPVNVLFGGGPNSGYSCDAGGPGCGADFYGPILTGGLRNYTPPEQGAGQITVTGINFDDLNEFVTSHPYGQNLTSGAFDPFGGGSEDSFINPRTGEVVTYDPKNPSEKVLKARKLSDAYARGEIDYPFYDHWEVLPLSAFDPKLGKRGGKRTFKSIVSQISGGSTQSATAPGGTPLIEPSFDQSLGQILADYGLETTVRLDGTLQTESPFRQTEGDQFQVRVNVIPNSSRANVIRDKSRLIDNKPMRFSGKTYDVEIVEDGDGKLMALGTGENSGHVFGEVRRGTSRFGGFRREGPWQAPPPQPTPGQQSSTGTSTASTTQENTGAGNVNCDSCPIQIPATRVQPARFHIVINSRIAQNDRVDMSNLFTDGFESGNTTAWTSTSPP